MERTSLYLVQSLPGISRWFEVEKREVVRIRAYSQVLILAQHSCSPGVRPCIHCFCFGLQVPGNTPSNLVKFVMLTAMMKAGKGPIGLAQPARVIPPK